MQTMTEKSGPFAALWALGALVVLWTLLLTTPPASAAPPDFPGLGPSGQLTGIQFEPAGNPLLRGRNARKQLVLTGRYSSGQLHDLTAKASFQVDNGQVLSVSSEGVVTPLSDGQATITASVEGQTASLRITAEKCQEERPINFANEIVPIFTKLGCNSGGCHGKASGQNGFKLSLLGFYPDEDYEYLAIEDRGRRVFPADPEFSLLLLKPTNQLPHGGGQRLDIGSYEWELLTSWIRQGMPQGSPDDPVLEGIEVFPKVRAMNRFTRQQLAVVGHYSDGSTRDVTHLASYEANIREMAHADSAGEVAVNDIPGDVAVMVRFQGEVTVFRAELPLGVPVESLPPLRNVVDEHVFAKLKKLGIPPSAICDDATFIRRVYVDITGRLPTAEQTKAFLAETDAEKRNRLIDRLIDSPGYADYFANKWSAVLRNRRRDQNDIPYTFRFHGWIREALAENMRYDEFARNILASIGDVESHPPVAWYREVNTSTQQMEDTAQLFLGMRLQCAKCHHHPFERWSQNDYYGFEAFFTQVALKQSKFNVNQNLPDQVYLRGNPPLSRNPRTNADVKPTGLGGEPIDIPAYEDARQYLVDWMVAPGNPFFARALVNRYWKHFFGRGIVEPEDDMRVTNPPSNPELLDALARHFVESGFDLKDLVRTICRSSVYQLSAEPNEYNIDDKQNFSSFYPRRLTAEVLYDAINQVADVPSSFGGVPANTLAIQLPDNGFNNYFLTVFGKPEAASACECERSPEANLAQSLHLLNSADIQGRLASGAGRAAKLANQQDLSDEQKITELYYWALSRPPRPEELQFVLEKLELQDPQNQNASAGKQQKYEDLLWALFNTKEFLFVR